MPSPDSSRSYLVKVSEHAPYFSPCKAYTQQQLHGTLVWRKMDSGGPVVTATLNSNRRRDDGLLARSRS